MENIELIEKEIGDVLEIEERVPMWKMPSVMGKDYTLILEHMKSEGIDCKEAPYTRYLDIDWDVEMNMGAIANFMRIFTKQWHFQVGMPASAKVEGVNKLIYRYIQKKKYVKTIHYGPYQKLGNTYKKVYTWAVSQKQLAFENESLEFYLNDPKDTKKESLETLVLIPVRSK